MQKIEVKDGKVINPEGLEINTVLHCNMRCRSCAHLSPLFRKKTADPESVRKELATLSKYYHASYVKIMGGEPLLHPNLIQLIQNVKSTGVADEILLNTNGTLLHTASDELWDEIDNLEISIYPSRVPSDERIELFRSKAAEHNVNLRINHYGSFRFSYSEKRNEDDDLVQDVYDTCKLAHFWHSHTLIDGWLFRCPQSVFMARQDVEGGWNNEVDGLQVSDDPEFTERLYQFLTSKKPLKACANCLGSVGKRHPHQELKRSEWRPNVSYEDLLSREYLEVCKQDITADDGCLISSEYQEVEKAHV